MPERYTGCPKKDLCPGHFLGNCTIRAGVLPLLVSLTLRMRSGEEGEAGAVHAAAQYHKEFAVDSVAMDTVDAPRYERACADPLPCDEEEEAASGATAASVFSPGLVY